METLTDEMFTTVPWDNLTDSQLGKAFYDPPRKFRIKMYVKSAPQVLA
jgi:hypothetical protein